MKTLIREAREALGLTQSEAAERIGINLGQYQRLEYGQRELANCSMRIGLSVCRVLNLDPYRAVFG